MFLNEGYKLSQSGRSADTYAFSTLISDLNKSAARSADARSEGRLPLPVAKALEAFNKSALAYTNAPSLENWHKVVTDSSELFRYGIADLIDLLQARAEKAKWRIVTELGFSLLILFLALGLTYAIGAGLIQRLRVLSDTMEGISKGDKIASIPFQQDRHETGLIVKTLATFKASLDESARLRAAQAHLEEKANTARRESMLQLADNFESTVVSIIERLATQQIA